MGDGEELTPSELAALKARVEFGTARIVDDDGDWLTIAGGIYHDGGTKMDRETMTGFVDAFLDLVEAKGLLFTGSFNLAVEDELDGGPVELDL